MKRKILNGWKEISNHIQRGVRTAQRWEAYLGMPVHRPALKDRSAVVAFSDELDTWIARPSDARIADDVAASVSGRNETLLRVNANVNALAWHTSELASQTRALQDQLRRSLESHRSRIASRMQTRPAANSSRAMGAMLPFRTRHTPGRQLLFP